MNQGKKKGRGYAAFERAAVLENSLDMRAQKEGRGVSSPGPRLLLPQ